jgi:hypothetical protein
LAYCHLQANILKTPIKLNYVKTVHKPDIYIYIWFMYNNSLFACTVCCHLIYSHTAAILFTVHVDVVCSTNQLTSHLDTTYSVLIIFILQLLHGPHTIMVCWLVVVEQLIGASVSGTHSQDNQCSV